MQGLSFWNSGTTMEKESNTYLVKWNQTQKVRLSAVVWGGMCRKMGHLCHILMTGCVSPLATLCHSASVLWRDWHQHTDRDCHQPRHFSGPVVRVCKLVCVTEHELLCSFRHLSSVLVGALSECVRGSCVCSPGFLVVTQCNDARLSWSHTDSCEFSWGHMLRNQPSLTCSTNLFLYLINQNIP